MIRGRNTVFYNANCKESLRANVNYLFPAMVLIVFQCSQVKNSFEVDRTSSLADVQQVLCRLHGQTFPAKKAVLTSQENTYDGFNQCRFATCKDGAIYEVRSVSTDEVLFYDKLDRIGSKITFKEEVAYDDDVAAGMTTSCIQEWVVARRAASLNKQ